MEKKNSDFDWKKLLNLDGSGVSADAFDESLIYKAIKRKNSENIKRSNKVYFLSLKYDQSITRFYYAEILSKYFSISNPYLAEYIFKLETEGQLSWSNLSSSIADLIMIEVQKYLTEKNIKANIITKKVEEDVVKKPGNDFA
ncbi:MAG: hypothetical protein K0Q51_394 [Rickettsiaceae bacterium]|jgi:hypothetical protein|nr:hypothetical protein [Rickettsiaceae bacterium]